MPPPPCAALAAGLLSGLVVDSGDGVSHAVAVVEGYVQPRATQRLNVAGRHVTARLLELLQRCGWGNRAAPRGRPRPPVLA